MPPSSPKKLVPRLKLRSYKAGKQSASRLFLGHPERRAWSLPPQDLSFFLSRVQSRLQFGFIIMGKRRLQNFAPGAFKFG